MFIYPINTSQLSKLKTNSVFNSGEWISIYSNNGIELQGIFNKNKELIGCFYYTNHKRAKFLIHVSPPFLSPHCGLYFEDNTNNPAQKNTFKKKVLEVIQLHFKGLKCDLLSVPFPPENIDMQSFIWNGFEASPKYTYQIDLNQSKEDILSKMSSERRKNIKKAQKDSIIAKFSLKNEDSENLIENTFTQQNLHYDKPILQSVFNDFSTTDNSFSFTSYQDKKPIATVFCVFDKEVAYYILGGYDKESRHEGAGALAMWEAIQYAKSKGISTFDFEGSMHAPIEKYFRGFGGELVSYFTIKKENSLGKILLKIRKK